MSERYMINRSFNTEDGTGELETRMEAIRYYCAPTKQYSGICKCQPGTGAITNSRILLGWCAVVPNCLH